jgi:hypothetical protein
VRRALLGTAVAVALLAAAEGVLEATVPKEKLLYPWETSTGFVQYDPVAGAWMEPGARHHTRDGPYPWHAVINAQGFREEVDTPVEKTGKRWLALGDSWIFGFSVEQGKTIPDQVEAVTAEAGAPVEVVNAGMVGFGAFDMLARWTALGDRYEWDGVLLGMPHNSSESRRVSAARSHLYENARPTPRSDLRLYLMLRNVVDRFRGSRFALPPEGEKLQDEVTDLSTLVGDAKKHGLDVVFIDLPRAMGGAIAADRAPEQSSYVGPLSRLGARIARHGMTERSCWGFMDIDHPGEAGDRAIAEVVAQVMTTGKDASPGNVDPKCSAVPGAGRGKPGWSWDAERPLEAATGPR